MWELNQLRDALDLSCSVAQLCFSFLFWWLPKTKNGPSPKKGSPFLPRVTEELRDCLVIDSVGFKSRAELLGVELFGKTIWVCVKIKPTGYGPQVLETMFPFARVPFWVPILNPHPFEWQTKGVEILDRQVKTRVKVTQDD